MTVSNPSNSPFLPSTYNVPDEETSRIEWFGLTLSEITDVLNDKVIGIYVDNVENFNGNKFYYDSVRKARDGYRFILRIKSYPNTGALVIPLPVIVNPQFAISQVYGSASKPCSAIGAGDGEYFSYYSEGNTRISFVMTDKEITITTTADMTPYSGFIVVDNIKDGQ